MIYLPGIFYLLVSFACFAFADVPSEKAIKTGLYIGMVVTLLMGILRLIREWIRRATTEIVVTSNRIIHKTGLIRRQTTEMNMGKVESVLIDQSVLGRFFDFGTVHIRGTGAGIDNLQMVDRPLELRTAIVAS